MALFRKVLFWCHLAAGVSAGVVVLIMSVTGVALTYQRQMQYRADAAAYRVPPPQADATPLAPAALLAAVQGAEAGFTPATIVWRRGADEPVALTAGTRTLYANPYTGAIHGEPQGAGTRAFFSTMVSWHRYLAMTGESRPTGRAITGAANLLFLFLVLSGMYLWWPRSWSRAQFRNVLWFRRGLTSKARDFNWHHVIGFWVAIPLAIVVYSATVISYPWASNLVYRVMGEAPPAPAAPRPAGAGSPGTQQAAGAAQTVAPDDALHARALAQDPEWQILTLRVAAPGAPVVYTIDRGDGGQPQLRGTLTLNAATGDAKWDGFDTQTPGRRARSWLRFLHTGEAAGLTGQTIAGLVSAGAVVLVYSGFALTWRRFRGAVRRAGSASPPEPRRRAA